MKKFIRGLVCLCLILTVAILPEMRAKAEEDENKILSGIFVEDMSLEGKTLQEAKDMVEEYVESISQKNITLIAVDGNEVQITPADIGLFWSNQDIVEEAAGIGRIGNVVQRYKASKDLQYQNKVYKLEFDIDRELTGNLLSEKCAAYNKQAVDATLSRVDGNFVINPGQNGQIIDETASLELIYNFFNDEWNRQDSSLKLVIKEDNSKGSEQELGQVKDVLGTFTTSFKTSGSSRSANVRNGCQLINGTTLYPGDEFSTYETVSPFTQENGYYMAGSYLNGQVVDSLGGGICQVSTTLYNAVLLSELEVTERHNHSMIVTYVDPSADAAIAESAGKDFKFVNNTQAPIYIEGYTTDDKTISFTIYGMETRSSNRQVSYESEVISKTHPDTEVIYTDGSLPIGSISVQSAHIGYKANLWKVVKEDGKEVSREMVNSSFYKAAPRTATVGVATADPNAYNEIMAAVATNNIDHVKNVAAALAAAAAPPAAQTPEGGTAPAASTPESGVAPAAAESIQAPAEEGQ